MLNWPAKQPTAVLDYTWEVPVDDGDSVSSYTASAVGATIDSDEREGNDVILTVSGGTAAETAIFTLTATTTQARTFHETIYLPIVASPSQIADTARSYVNFALRKIIGNGNDPESTELDDALERLNALVAQWRAGGADIGAAFPITANTIIYCPDWAVSALRYNLLLDCYSNYDAEPSAMDVLKARQGLQLVKHMNLPATREGAAYY